MSGTRTVLRKPDAGSGSDAGSKVPKRNAITPLVHSACTSGSNIGIGAGDIKFFAIRKKLVDVIGIGLKAGACAGRTLPPRSARS